MRSERKDPFRPLSVPLPLAMTPVYASRRCKLTGTTQPPSLRTPTRRNSSRRSKLCLLPAYCHPLGSPEARVSARPDGSAQSLACFGQSWWSEALRVGPKILLASVRRTQVASNRPDCSLSSSLQDSNSPSQSRWTAAGLLGCAAMPHRCLAPLSSHIVWQWLRTRQ
jgi:hypothetical protein